jgi:hypothetical protein
MSPVPFDPNDPAIAAVLQPTLDTTQEPAFHPSVIQQLLGGFAGAQNAQAPAPINFGEGLVSGLRGGLGSAGSRIEARQAQLEQRMLERQALRDKANLEATQTYQKQVGEARGKAAERAANSTEVTAGEIAAAPKGSAISRLTPGVYPTADVMKARTAAPDKVQAVSVLDPATGKAKYVAAEDAVKQGLQPYEKPERPGAPIAVIDPTTGKAKYVSPDKAIGMEPAKSGAAAADFDPHDYVDPDKADTSTLGFKYVNLASIPDKKQQAAVAAEARKQGVPVINQKEKDALDLVDKARLHFSSLAGEAGLQPGQSSVLPRSGVDIRRGINSVEGATGIQLPFGADVNTMKGLKAYSDLAISAVQGTAALGTGLRLNQPQLVMTLKNNIVQPGDSEGTARKKLSVTGGILDDVERALLQPKNAKQAATQAGTAASRTRPPLSSFARP